MPNIYHDLPVNASKESVFHLISTANGLSKWWSIGGTGEPGVGNIYDFDFGPGYQWKAVVEEYERDILFVLKMSDSDSDWNGTLLRFRLEASGDGTLLRFEHLNWPLDNDHYRSSSYCWAMYLRCLKIYAETGISIDY
jgi:uncharacterized protein YndB with AHSA1/START domain